MTAISPFEINYGLNEMKTFASTFTRAYILYDVNGFFCFSVIWVCEHNRRLQIISSAETGRLLTNAVKANEEMRRQYTTNKYESFMVDDVQGNETLENKKTIRN